MGLESNANLHDLLGIIVHCSPGIIWDCAWYIVERKRQFFVWHAWLNVIKVGSIKHWICWKCSDVWVTFQAFHVLSGFLLLNFYLVFNIFGWAHPQTIEPRCRCEPNVLLYMILKIVVDKNALFLVPCIVTRLS